MKKILFPLALLVIISCGRVTAAAVTIATAKTIATNFFNLNTANGGTNTATLNYTRTESDGTIDYYVFDISPAHGFVIVSADDNLNPVIAYSTESNFNSSASKVGVSDWLKHSAAKIHFSIQQHIPADTRITNLWNSYTQGLNPVSSRSGSVGPLLSTTWDQEPNYNALCPFNSTDNQRAVTGCVATAMAQIMKYWAYPAQGKGSYSYDDSPPNFSNTYGTQSANFATTVYNWTNMPASINSANNDIATLMYQCGVSVAMDYGDDNQGGSGAWVLQSEAGGNNAPCAQYSYVNYFSHNPNTIQGVTMSQYNAADWMTMMKNELDAGRVIQYEGDDPQAGGHTWVCDGYDANNMLHMNWGWSGQDDGYFDVSNLNAGSYNFSTGEAALIGIEPISPVNVVASALNAAICPAGNTTLTAQGPSSATYSWTPTTGLSCSTCASTAAAPSNTTVYTVTADSAGIHGTATVTVVITPAVTANFSLNATPTCAIPATISFVNSSNNATNYLWDFGDGTTGTDLNPIHAYANYGSYTVRLLSSNACGSDSVIKSQFVQITDQAPGAVNQNICLGQTATLSATGAGTLNWYDAPTGGNFLGTGSSYSTTALNSSTTYYVSANLQSGLNSAGPVDNTFGTGGYFTSNNQHSVIFNCTTPQNLLTVDVYAQNSGDRIIQLQDSVGGIIDSVTEYIPSGLSTVTLNFAVPAQDNLYLAVVGNNGLYRNKSGANYPYTSTDGTIVLTNSDAGQAGYYYFFYNWKLQQSACVTNRTPVVVNVLGTNAGPFSATALGNNTVNFTPSNSGVPSYTWIFGDGNTSTLEKPNHTYTSPGSYTVTLIESNGSCSDTISQTISTLVNGINDLSALGNIKLFPNPAKDQLNLKVNATEQLNDCQLIIHNILGETVITQNISLNAGANSIDMNVASLNSGVYLLTLQNGKNTVTKRFVKTN